jgi:hypothetical protein
MIWRRRAFYDTANVLVMLGDSPHFRLEDVNFKGGDHSLSVPHTGFAPVGIPADTT